MLNENEFIRKAAETLNRIENLLLESGVDLDVEMVGDGVMEIQFSNGSKIVVNRHQVAQEIWVAARSGGFHFRWNGLDWLETRGGEALLPMLSRLVSSQAGEVVNLF